MGNLSKVLLTLGTLAGVVSGSPALATYSGPPILAADGEDLGPWFSSLWSEYGRCCEKTDALIDVYWEPSKTSTSGYAIIVNGAKMDVDKDAAHIFTYSHDPYASTDGFFTRHDVTDNKARVAIAWLQDFGYDENGNPIQRVRCLLPGAAN